MKKWVHSVPTWTMGPRGANPKFQAGVVVGGIAKVKDRLIAIQELSNRLQLKAPLLTSMHILHEMDTSITEYYTYNGPNAIDFNKLKDGIRAGDFPRILAITAPAFGFRCVENGAILSPDPMMQRMARCLHEEALERAKQLQEEGLGEGVVIWWPAFDTRRGDLLDESNILAEDVALQRMEDFWVDVLGGTEGVIWLEWKPSDPGTLDYIWNLGLAIALCNRVNEKLGRRAMVINNEWAHLLIGGLTVEEGTRRIIDAGLFTGFVHVNSAQLFPINIEKVMQSKNFIEVPSGIDWDWAVGIGGNERWEDQKAAVRILDNLLGIETIFAEHDINPAGQNPVSFAEVSIRNLEHMLQNVQKC